MTHLEEVTKMLQETVKLIRAAKGVAELKEQNEKMKEDNKLLNYKIDRMGEYVEHKDHCLVGVTVADEDGSNPERLTCTCGLDFLRDR